MTKNQHGRRNFLSCLAILSAGTVIGSPLKSSVKEDREVSLDKKWATFWEDYGGELAKGNSKSTMQNEIANTAGHYYKNGEVVFFSKENILAQPTWIYWGEGNTYPADVVITLFENNEKQNKISRLNRFEIDALYKLANEYKQDQLLLTHHTIVKPVNSNTTTYIQNKTFVNRHSNCQQVSYYKQQELIFHKKFIFHT
jgi:hypothetical protein